VSGSMDYAVKQVMLSDDGTFPNNPLLPLMLYPGAFLPFGSDPAADIEARFNANRWPAAWRNGVYDFHHYHSEAHEALGVYRGWAKVQFGGPNGDVIQITSGDAAVLPAGTAHKLIDSSSEFAVVGAYPPSQQPDMLHGKPGERPVADERIARVPMPDTDPVTGTQGGLLNAWRVEQ
jgi:uncharacterized protein YjlB